MSNATPVRNMICVVKLISLASAVRNAVSDFPYDEEHININHRINIVNPLPNPFIVSPSYYVPLTFPVNITPRLTLK